MNLSRPHREQNLPASTYSGEKESLIRSLQARFRSVNFGVYARALTICTNGATLHTEGLFRPPEVAPEVVKGRYLRRRGPSPEHQRCTVTRFVRLQGSSPASLCRACVGRTPLGVPLALHARPLGLRHFHGNFDRAAEACASWPCLAQVGESVGKVHAAAGSVCSGLL